MSQFNTVQWNTSLWNNGLALDNTIPANFKIYSNDTSILLKWADFPNSNYYQIQVSLNPDMSAPFVDTSSTITEYSFTDSQTNDKKRYWRVRASVDSGSSYAEPWSEIGSYWLNTSGAQDVTLARDQWALFDPDSITDISLMELFPPYSIMPEHLYHFRERNRLGDMLSEYVILKSKITLNFSGRHWIDWKQFTELRRFNEEIKTFFVATYKDGNQGKPMPHIWKVQYETNPALTMLAPGREELTQGTLVFIET